MASAQNPASLTAVRSDLSGSQKAVPPLRTIIDRPAQLLEHLECGHIINRPCGLGEDLMKPSKVKKRRCYVCRAEAQS